MVQPKKKQRVKELIDLLQGAESIVLNDFTGMNVGDVSELRRVCRENGITFRVIKNTLGRRSCRELGLEELEPFLDGPTAIAVSTEGEATPAQVIKKFADDYELPRLKGGYVAGRVLSRDDVLRLASLPGREILISQVIGTFQAPLRGLINCLGASLRDLVFVLKAVSDKKDAA